MTNKLKVAMLLSILPISGCLPVSSPENVGGQVILDQGTYKIGFYYHILLDEFGPGWRTVQKEVELAADEDKTAIWDRAVAEALPKYMDWAGLIPSECRNGIVVLGHNADISGSALASFECKEQFDEPPP